MTIIETERIVCCIAIERCGSIRHEFELRGIKTAKNRISRE